MHYLNHSTSRRARLTLCSAATSFSKDSSKSKADRRVVDHRGGIDVQEHPAVGCDVRVPLRMNE